MSRPSQIESANVQSFVVLLPDFLAFMSTLSCVIIQTFVVYYHSGGRAPRLGSQTEASMSRPFQTEHSAQTEEIQCLIDTLLRTIVERTDKFNYGIMGRRRGGFKWKFSRVLTQMYSNVYI